VPEGSPRESFCFCQIADPISAVGIAQRAHRHVCPIPNEYPRWTWSQRKNQFETQSIDRLRPYSRNPTIHCTDQVAKIAPGMAKFGWTVPCLIADDSELIAGHRRVLAVAMLELSHVPVILLTHLDEAERCAYRIADNKLTELGEWDGNPPIFNGVHS
jgi:ParB-like nuclease domain